MSYWAGVLVYSFMIAITPIQQKFDSSHIAKCSYSTATVGNDWVELPGT